MSTASLAATSKSPIPLYVQVADTLRDRIAKGVWSPDQPMPRLEALASEFGVARLTARQAVQLLAEQGLVSPQRGRGTFVRATAEPPKAVTLVTSLKDLANRDESATTSLLAIDVTGTARPPLSGQRGVLLDSYVFMKRLHRTDDRPFGLVNLHLASWVFALERTKFRKTAVIPLLLNLPGVEIASAHQTLTMSAADAETARLLELPAGAPLACIERVFIDPHSHVVYHAETKIRGDRLRWEIDLR